MLVTELMERGDLYSLLGRHQGRFAWHRLGRCVALDVARGLSFLHSRNIVHFECAAPQPLHLPPCCCTEPGCSSHTTLQHLVRVHVCLACCREHAERSARAGTPAALRMLSRSHAWTFTLRLHAFKQPCLLQLPAGPRMSARCPVHVCM